MKATFNLRIDAELKTKFSQKLKERDETATSVVVRAIEAYCNDSNDSNAVTPVSNDSTNVTLVSNDSNDVTLEQQGTSTVHSQEVSDLRREVDRLKHEMRWGDRYFSDLQSQVYSLKSSLNSLETSIEQRLEQYLMDNPDRELETLWDSIDYVGEKIDKLSPPSDNSDSTIEVIYDTPDMSREKEATRGSTPSEIPLEATKEESEDVSSRTSTEAPDEPHKEVSEDNTVTTKEESSIDTPTTEETPIDSDGEWKPLDDLAEELGIEKLENLKTNISKKFGKGGTYATHTLRKGRGKIEVRREVMQSGRTKNGSMMARKID